MAATLEAVKEALERNGFAVTLTDTVQDVPAAVAALLPDGARVATGGSVSLAQSGVGVLLRRGPYTLLDRNDLSLTPEQKEELARAAFSADVFLCSANAVTEQGELYCVDGYANRITALAYGPRQVVLVVGANKIVPDLPAAIRRVKTVAAPQNTVRLHCATPCAETGHCLSCGTPGETVMTAGCSSPQRICRDYLVLGPQKQQGRIHIVLCRESLGY